MDEFLGTQNIIFSSIFYLSYIKFLLNFLTFLPKNRFRCVISRCYSPRTYQDCRIMNSRHVFQTHQHFSTRSDWEMRNYRYQVQNIWPAWKNSVNYSWIYMLLSTYVMFLHILGTDGSFLPDHIWDCRSEDDLSSVPFPR